MLDGKEKPSWNCTCWVGNLTWTNLLKLIFRHEGHDHNCDSKTVIVNKRGHECKQYKQSASQGWIEFLSFTCFIYFQIPAPRKDKFSALRTKWRSPMWMREGQKGPVDSCSKWKFGYHCNLTQFRWFEWIDKKYCNGTGLGVTHLHCSLINL